MNGVPYIDIYTITRDRSKQCIERFLEAYTNRSEIEDQKDGELMILPPDKVGKVDLELEDYTWVKAHTVSNSIAVGLSGDDVCFTMYLASNFPGVDQAILSFTADNFLILGLAVYEYTDENQTVDNYGLADKLAKQLETDYSGIERYYGLESAPSDTYDEFLVEKSRRQAIQ